MLRSSCVALALLAAGASPAVQAAAPTIDTATIESVTGLKGSYNKAENVFKVSKPRDDVKINVDRWTMPPFMGLTSWAAFTPMGSSTMIDRKSTRLNSSHLVISYAVFCLKKKKITRSDPQATVPVS